MPVRAVVDSGPLVAFFDKDDQYHQQACEFLRQFDGELVSTAPVLTEVCYLLDFSVQAQIDFLNWVCAGGLTLVDLTPGDLCCIIDLTRKYADLPMDFADASLVAIGERLGMRQVVTMDADFYVYRTRDKTAFQNLFFPDR